MTVSIIGANVLTEQWRVVAATKTKTILVQSKSDDNSIGCQFNLRLRYGVEGVETPIYSQETTTFLEPNQARLIDFRELVPGDFQDSYPVGAWQIEAQIAYNFAPILIRYYEVDLRDADKAFYQGQLNGKADSDHEHVPSDIANLETLLLAKLNAPTTPPTPGQILRATGPDTWTWQTVQTGDGGGVVLPAEFVTTVNGETGDVVIDPPPLATSTQSGLISAQLFALLTGQNATNGQALQIIGGIPTWGNLTVFATPVQWQKLTANATLETDKRYFLKGGSEFTLPATVSGSIEISNQTTNAIAVIASGTAKILGIESDGQTAISQQSRVSIAPGQTGKLIADSGNWECQDCSNPSVEFVWGNTPPQVVNNLLNTQDLFRFLGEKAGNGSWINPAGTSWLTAVARTAVSWNTNPNVLTDRQQPIASAGFNIVLQGNPANSWIGWRFPGEFTPTGLLLITNGIMNTYHPRNFSLRVGNTSSLTVDATITALPTAQIWVNQSQITGLGSSFYFPCSTALSGNTLILQFNSNGSSNEDFNALGEACLYGKLRGSF